MLFGILKFIFIALEVILLFNLLIVVHELGHFLAARWRGLVVEKFAIWFGKPLWSKKIGGVEYRLGSIPAGGYVAIPQLAPMEALEGKTEADRAELPPAKALDKIIVAAAGPLFSFGLAFLMACVVWGVGKPENEMDSTTIGYVLKGGPAEKAGLQAGDQILKVDGSPVKHFGGTDGIKWRIIRSEGETIPFEVKRGDQVLTINSGWTKAETSSWKRPALRQVMMSPRATPRVGVLMRGGVAAQAGLKADDLITSIDGKPITDLDELGEAVKNNMGGSLALGVDRNGQKLALKMAVPQPKKGDEMPDLGVAEWGRTTFSHPSPWSQVEDAATSIFRMIGALMSKNSDVKISHFSGPVGILTMYYRVFESTYGWQYALSLSVLINVNLALINLLPFPVLDGGHILLAIIEAIRRRPINIKILEFVQTGCALLIIGFMIYVTFYDIGDFIPSKKAEVPPTIEKK